jgi:hypothetical protein
MLGISFRLRVLVVCHCFRVCDRVIRIISARELGMPYPSLINLYLRECSLTHDPVAPNTIDVA